MNKKSKSQKQRKPLAIVVKEKSHDHWDFETGGANPFKLAIKRNMRLHSLHRPLKPWRGAQLTLKMQPSTFTTSSGLTNVGGGSGPAQFVINSSSVANAALAFNAADLAGFSTLASLFDQYRLDKVLIRLKARSNAVAVQNIASPNASVPSCYIVRDLDDATALTTVSEYLEYDTCETFSGTEDVVCSLVPAITKAVWSGAFSGYTVEKPGWLDMANTSIPHYGIKFGGSGLTATTTSSWVWDITAEYIVSFLNSR